MNLGYVLIMATGGVETFEEWVKSNGGDEEFLSLLTECGFTSKLSLGFLDLDSDDGKRIQENMNYGQRCLLYGLIKLCPKAVSSPRPSEHVEDSYSSGVIKSQSLLSCTKKQGIKQKLGKLFNFEAKKPTAVDSEDEFQPLPVYKSLKGKGGKGKGVRNEQGKCSKTTSAPKRKVKEFRLRVIPMPSVKSCTPTGTPREYLLKDVWVRTTASEEEVFSKIQQQLGWKHREKPQYMYAQGRNLRLAVLSDVEGAESWDAEAVKVLMGCGFLYLVKTGGYSSNSDSEVRYALILTILNT